jgi:hypothetical protein
MANIIKEKAEILKGTAENIAEAALTDENKEKMNNLKTTAIDKIKNDKRILIAVIAVILAIIVLPNLFGGKKLKSEYKTAIVEDYEKMFSGNGKLTDLEVKLVVKGYEDDEYWTVIGRVKGSSLDFKYVEYGLSIYKETDTFDVGLAGTYESKKDLKEALQTEYEANKKSFGNAKKY